MNSVCLPSAVVYYENEGRFHTVAHVVAILPHVLEADLPLINLTPALMSHVPSDTSVYHCS